jgi:hypothetical protein
MIFSYNVLSDLRTIATMPLGTNRRMQVPAEGALPSLKI